MSGVGPAVFQSAGQRSEHVVPGAYSRSAAVGGAGSGVSANNGVVLGRSRGGQPGRLFVFASLEEARETLVDGELLKGVAHAFTPSSEFSPQAIRAMVVNGNTQAEAVLSSGGVDVLRLRTAGWGVVANGVARLITDGTNPGTRRIRFSKGEAEDVIDNIGRRSIQLNYTGDGSAAALSVNADGITVEVIGADSISNKLIIPFEDFPTIEEVVSRLNGTGEFAAVKLETDANVPSSELDHVDSVDLMGGAVTLSSDFFALFRALEISPWIGRGNVERIEGSPNRLPDNDADPVFFDGASAGTYTVADWNRTLAALETENIQMITTPNTNRAVHTLISNHCTAMSNVKNRRERTALLGGPIGETVDEAVEAAAAFNNRLVSYCYPGIRASSPLTGEAEELPASFFACKLMGMETVVAIHEPLTWKSVGVLGFLVRLRIPEMETLIRGGVLCGGVTDDNRLAVIRAMTTHRGRQLQLVERSMVRLDLFMNRDLRMRISAGVGRPSRGAGGVADAEGTLYGAAREWKGMGFIVPDGQGNNVWGVVARVVGDKTLITFHRNLTAPQNFFFITAFNHVYESAASVEV